MPSFLPDAPKPMKLLGVAFNTFILVEYEDHLLMIDQHAVHERLLFDRLMKAYDQHACGQELLLPMVLAWYILTELGSILENAVHLGANPPGWLVKALEAGKKAVEDAGEQK